jgi:GAF domain-containing protein
VLFLRPESDQGTGLEEFSPHVCSGIPLDEVLDRIAVCAVHALNKADASSVLLLQTDISSTLESAAACGKQTEAIDAAQIEAGVGPAIDAFVRNETVTVEMLDTDARYGDWAQKVAFSDVRGVASFPISIGDTQLGVLNLYSSHAMHLTDADRVTATTLAACAAAAILNARAQTSNAEAIENLHRALHTRGVIERAKGMLMASRNICDDDAFAVLRKSSQFQNKKLFDVAAGILQAHADAMAKRSADS